MVQRPRGTRDFGPDEMGRRVAFERLCDEVGTKFGFTRVATPTFERLELFTAKSGQGIIDQLYAFKDRSERDLTLRPELTAPVMRMVAEKGGQISKPARWSYFGPCFRYEESKAGRYREFWQYGCEIIGASGTLVEAEVIAFACSLLDACGLNGWVLRIGHVGILRDALAALGMSEDATSDVMRLLDKGEIAALAGKGVPEEACEKLAALAALDGGVETIPAARDILASMGAQTDSLAQLESMLSSLAAMTPGIAGAASPQIDLTVARGLDYYTGVVFEVEVDELGGEGQVLGGGSYNLLHLFGLEDLDPCCGFGLGFDRVLSALEKQAERENRDEVVPGQSAGGSLAVIPFNIDADAVLPLVAALRAAGVAVVVELRTRNLGRSMSWANNAGAAFALVIGPRDIESGQTMVKRLSDGEQAACSLDAEAIAGAVASLR